MAAVTPIKLLVDAIKKQDLDTTKKLLMDSAILKQLKDGTLDDEGLTPLHHAAIHDTTPTCEILNHLLVTGAPPNILSKTKFTAFHLAISNGNALTAKTLLLASDINTFINILSGTEEPFIPLEIAIYHHSPKIVELILFKENMENAKISDANSQYIANRNFIKRISHIMGIGTQAKKTKTIPVTIPGKWTVDIKTEANLTHLSLRAVIDNFKNYIDDDKVKKTAEKKARLKKIYESYKTTLNFLEFKGETFKSLSERYERGEVVALPITVPGHDLAIAFYGDYLIYCNRGAGGRKEIKIYKMTSEERKNIMDETFLQTLYLEKGFVTDAHLNDFLAKKINSFATSGGHTYALARKDQRYGNCSYVNINSMIEAIDFLLAMEEAPRLGETPEEQRDRCLKAANEDYHQRTRYGRDKCAVELIDELKKSRVAGSEERHRICLNLITYTISEHHGLRSSLLNVKRPEKVAEELSRVCTLLEGLTKEELRTVIMNLNLGVDKNKRLLTILKTALKQGDTPFVKSLVDEIVHFNTNNIISGNEPHSGSIYDKDIAVVEMLIKSKVDVNTLGIALIEASREGNIDITNILLKAKANVNAINKRGRTALMEASMRRHTAIVELLLKEKADVNATDVDGSTALIEAVGAGNTAIVELLLKAKADIGVIVLGEYTALMLAAESGHATIVEALLKAGANINATMKNGQSVLALAVIEGRVEVLKILLGWVDLKNITFEYINSLLPSNPKAKHIETHKLLHDAKTAFELEHDSKKREAERKATLEIEQQRLAKEMAEKAAEKTGGMVTYQADLGKKTAEQDKSTEQEEITKERPKIPK